MNTKAFVLGLVACGAFLSPSRAETDRGAGQKPAAPAPTAPWVATENDAVGHWLMGPPEGWRFIINADHTVAVYRDGVITWGPFISNWKLTGNHITLSGVYIYRGPGSEDTDYKAPPFKTDFGNDLQVIRVNGHTVLLPSTNIASAQKYGYGSAFCFWHYTVQQGMDALPQDALDLDKATYKILRRERNKQR